MVETTASNIAVGVVGESSLRRVLVSAEALVSAHGTGNGVAFGFADVVSALVLGVESLGTLQFELAGVREAALHNGGP